MKLKKTNEAMESRDEKMSNKRNWIFVLSIFFLIIAVSVANARVERNYKNTAAEHINLVVDSIDFRSDLTRVYARLIGRPHTSQKIIKIELKEASRSHEAVDIDGVDFKRWFQWEDDGVIPVEIDFKAMAPVKTGTLVIETARGVDSSRFSK